MPPSLSFRIAGQAFTIPCRCLPGHRLTPGEAQALNGLLIEICRKNRWPGLARTDTPLADAQQAIYKYASEYQFRLSTRAQGAPDPVRVKAWELAAASGAADEDEIALRAEDPDLLAQAAKMVEMEEIAAAEALRELTALAGEG